MLKMIGKIIFYFIIFILSGFIFLVAYLLSTKHEAAILMYHSVGQPVHGNEALNVSEEAFEKQMRFLKRYHYHVIPFLQLLDLLKEGKPIPWGTVVLTFDDGFRNNYTTAYPILKKYHFPATIFVITKKYEGKKDFLTPAMVKEMSDSGLITIGAHTRYHLYLPDVEDKKLLWEEIRGSKEDLEKIVNKPVDVFCYPVGGYNRALEEAVQEAGYKAAVGTFPGRGAFQGDLYAIRRIKATENSKNPFIFFVQTSGYFLQMRDMHEPKKCNKKGER